MILIVLMIPRENGGCSKDQEQDHEQDYYRFKTRDKALESDS
jgi:hypothetical protein